MCACVRAHLVVGMGYSVCLCVCVWPILMFLGPTCIASLVVLLPRMSDARKSNAATNQ